MRSMEVGEYGEEVKNAGDADEGGARDYMKLLAIR